MSQRKIGDMIILLVIALVGSFLIFKNLDRCMLWQDEAETANVSRTILKDGLPKGFDGLNYFSQQEGGELGKNYVWKLHPWVQFYADALSFALFGISTFTARLPFAMLGLASLLLFYLLSLKIWRDRQAALISVFLLLLCIPFLLLVRQARYYAAEAFFMIYLLYAYQLCIAQKKFGFLHLGMALIFLFHTHYLYYITSIPVLIVHAWIYHKTILKKILIVSGITLVINIPFLLWITDTPFSKQNYKASLLDPERLFWAVKSFIVAISRYVFSPLLLLIPVFLFFFKKEKLPALEQLIPSHIMLLIFLVGANIAALSILSLEYYFRYLTPLIPVLMLLATYMLMKLKKVHASIPWIAAAALVIYMNPLTKYLRELNDRHYRGPITGLVKVLKENMSPGDTVVITFGDLPLKFYFRDHKIYGGMTGENMEMALHAKWIILRRNVISPLDRRTLEYLQKNVNWKNYESAELDYPDAVFENRESPEEHFYGSARADHKLIIFRRKESK